MCPLCPCLLLSCCTELERHRVHLRGALLLRSMRGRCLNFIYGKKKKIGILFILFICVLSLFSRVVGKLLINVRIYIQFSPVQISCFSFKLTFAHSFFVSLLSRLNYDCTTHTHRSFATCGHRGSSLACLTTRDREWNEQRANGTGEVF